MKLTKRNLFIITFALALILAIGALLGIYQSRKAFAEGKVTVTGANVFNATGDAKVAVNAASDSKFYSTLSFSSDSDNVSYRRNLAYSWYEEVNSGTGESATKSVQPGWFNMEIGFKSEDFKKFVVTFESQQYNKTKDGKTQNFVMFFPAATTGKVYVLITDNKDAAIEDVEDRTGLDATKIKIEFTGKYTADFSGGYEVKVSDEVGISVTDRFKNVSGNYSKASTSSTTPVYPLIFTTYFKGDEEVNTGNLDVTLYSLNGQSFETTSSSANTVKDDKAPVLCLEDQINHFNINSELDFNYVVIDVLRSSPSSTVNYYLLTYDQYTDGEIDYNDKKLFKEVETDLLLESDIDKYLPVERDLAGKDVYSGENKLTVDMLAKVYVKLTDTSSSGESSEVFLDWYISEEYLINVKDTPFIAVAKDELGITYNYGEDWDSIIEAYQAKVTELAKNLSAGSSSYMYLPSAETLFASTSTAYPDMKISIYYYNSSKQSNTNLAASNLSITVTQQGPYKFTLYATDVAGNKMYYIDGNGEVKEFASSEIWNMFDDRSEGGLYYKLPWFTFYVSYTGVSFEEVPGMQSTAYVGTNYSAAKFNINGISNSYTTSYRLFLFNRAKYTSEHESITYSEFIDKMDDLYENNREYFTEIPVAATLMEGSDEYELYYKYGWSGSSTSFTPQVANTFYYIRAEVKDNQYIANPVTCSLAVVSSEAAKVIPGEDDWVENNVASIVLLCVAGAALIGIILLLVIKPKDKGDIEERYETAKNKKAKK